MNITKNITIIIAQTLYDSNHSLNGNKKNV